MMKNYLFFIFLSISYISTAQNKLMFFYDNAGNQIKRELCISGCFASKKADMPIKEVENLTQEDLLKFSPEDAISYYPNPVKEELYLSWQPIDDNNVKIIKIYNINGQLIDSFNQNKPENNSQNISFNTYPNGVYLIELLYKDGEQKTIKIIKQ